VIGKRVRQAGLLVASAFIATACGSTAASTNPSATEGTGPSATSAASAAPTEDTRKVELSFMNWYWGPGDEESYTAIIENYKAKDPRLANVAIEVQPYERYNDVLNVKMAGDHPPDIAWLDLSVGRRYVESGRLKDLRPTLESIDGWDIADWTPASLAGWSDGDAIYALPFTNATNSVFYNKEAFAKAGIPTPDDMVASGTWTWDNLKSTAKALQDSGVVRYGFYHNNEIFVNGWRNLIEIWNAYGGGPWSSDGKTCTFDSPETIQATQLIHDMIYKDKSHPGPGVDVLFLTGDIGMSLARPDEWDPSAEFEWSVVSQPDGPKGYVPSVAQNGLAVFDGPNADIAALLVADMLSKENMEKYPVFPPGNRVSLHTPELLLQSIPAFTPEQVEGTVIKAFSSPNQVLEYNHPNFGPISTTASRLFDSDMWKPDADVSGALTNVCANVKDLLG
jgi:multiple sugar transport system substrate-binding protein